MPPGRQQKKSRDKGPLTRPGSPVIAPLNPGQLRPLVSPFPPLGSPLTASAGRPGPSGPPHFLNRSERVNYLFPQACVNPASFPRAFTPTLFDPISGFHPDNRQKSSGFHPDTYTSNKTNRRLQVVRTAGSVNKPTGTKKPNHRRKSLPEGIAQRSDFATPRTRTDFQRLRRCETVLQERLDRRQVFASTFPVPSEAVDLTAAENTQAGQRRPLEGPLRFAFSGRHFLECRRERKILLDGISL